MEKLNSLQPNDKYKTMVIHVAIVQSLRYKAYNWIQRYHEDSYYKQCYPLNTFTKAHSM